MDFNRGGQFRLNNSAATPAQGKAAASTSDDNHSSGIKKKFKGSNGLLRWGYLALLLSGTILFIAMIFFLVFGTPLGREAKYVDKDQYQAVFVNVNGTNGGQVYFGRITSLTAQYIRLTNVFYIQNQQSDAAKSTSSAYNLVKLGCELHGPSDEMLINRDQVFFWENLKTDSQVAQKAAEFYKQNPNGQKCDTTTTNQPTTTNETNSNASTTGNTTGTNPTNTNSTTNKTTTGQ